MPIFEQLKLEEALLRTSEENFCIINEGSSPAVVMGISGNPEALLNLESVQREKIPVIQRFSGGGTVVVDENTLFITFIMSKKDLEIDAFPEPILRWSADLYQKAWQIPNFHLRENDYCIEDRKCGGNAQYITKNRWLHHTSFLWDYSPTRMQHLLLPPKRPKYRLDRAHESFLTKLKEHVQDRKILIEKLKSTLESFWHLNVKPLYITENHRKSTRIVEI